MKTHSMKKSAGVGMALLSVAAAALGQAVTVYRCPGPSGGVEYTNGLTPQQAKGPATIDRFGMQRQVVVSANLEAGAEDLRGVLTSLLAEAAKRPDQMDARIGGIQNTHQHRIDQGPGGYLRDGRRNARRVEPGCAS